MARGGMGEVFRALAFATEGVEQPVAIKRIVPMHAGGSSGLTELFVARASMMTRLAHPNIVEVLDFGVGEDGDFYLIFELVHGTDLGRLCKGLWALGESVPVPVALYIAAEVLKGLGHAHERSEAEGQLLVHRDVSPGNVIISSAGAVKIADFGVAIATRDETEAAGRDLVGKPSYMAPEQFDGEEVDARADIFSMGVVLFQTLTGSRPFPGSSAATRMAAARDGQLLKASELRPEVSEELEALLGRALAARREDRFQDARAMLAAIEALRDTSPACDASGELAQRVTAILREPPESRSGAPPAPDPAEDVDLVGCELTRNGAIDPFTLRVIEHRDDLDGAQGAGAAVLDWDAPPPAPVGPFSSAPPSSAASSVSSPSARPPLLESETLEPLVHGSPASSRPTAERDPVAPAVGDGHRRPPSVRAPTARGKQRLLGTALGVAALGALALAGLRTGGRGATGADGAASDGAASARPVVAAAVRASLARSAGSTAATESVAAKAVAQPTAPPCEGDVQLDAAQAWRVSGGPAEVQAPGRYRWPCGSFSLQATSGGEPSRTTQVSVTVTGGGTAVVELR
jgi:eukaryotic-like serine/threonine-protein kinase